MWGLGLPFSNKFAIFDREDIMAARSDKPKDECGVIGIFGHAEASNIAYLGLYALQHRGQESAGIVVSNGRSLHMEKRMGLVADVFSEERLRHLQGEAAIGHVRYSTAGSSNLANAQPFMASYHQGSLALAHNGNLVNSTPLRAELEAAGAIFSSTSDSEVMVHLIARSSAASLLEGTIEALQQVRGAYSLVLMNEEELLGIRDPFGFRPLSLGKFKGGYALASETCAFDLIEAEFIRDVEPGEIVQINKEGVHSHFPFLPAKKRQCIFEYIYLARPDSFLFGHSVHQVRHRLGSQLGKEAPAQADLVVPVPDSGVYAALGYARQSGIPFEHGLIRNHYIGRTFIEPKQSIRHFGVKIKLNAVRQVLEGKRVVVVDDSIVRGTTSRKIVSMIKAAGAREVHLRISSPPIISPCYYGIDTPTRKELIASTHDTEEICRYLKADSLAYLSLEGMMEAVGEQDGFCLACFTGQYPISFHAQELAQLALFENA
jgi:amidophosphoribosyltransferase